MVYKVALIVINTIRQVTLDVLQLGVLAKVYPLLQAAKGYVHRKKYGHQIITMVYIHAVYTITTPKVTAQHGVEQKELGSQ